MGFASGFRTGLATGGERRSMMPIVQGLGSMIDRIERRQKKGSIRFGGKIDGESSYDKYTARKDKEAAQAEEQRRYDQQEKMQREQMETNQAAAAEEQERQAVADEQKAQMHEAKIGKIQEDRERAAKLFERSEKKEDRIEAYRGFIQGIQSRNKELTEASWAALAPDQEKGKEADWAEIETEDYIDPATGQPVPQVDPETGEPTGENVKKFIVGRGKGDKKGMPAPSVEYNEEDGSIAVTWPGSQEPEIFPDAQTFAEKVGYPMNPEFEKGKGDKDKKKKEKTKTQMTAWKEELKYKDQDLKELETLYKNDAISQEDYDAKRAPLIEDRNKLRAQITGKKPKEQPGTAVAKEDAEAVPPEEATAAAGPEYKKDTKSGLSGYAGKKRPTLDGKPIKGARRRSDGIWFRPNPEPPPKWQIVTDIDESPTEIALEQGD